LADKPCIRPDFNSNLAGIADEIGKRCPACRCKRKIETRRGMAVGSSDSVISFLRDWY